MTEKSRTPQERFVRQVVSLSLIIAAFLASIAVLIAANIDGIRAAASIRQAARGNYSVALETAQAIEDTETQLESHYGIAEHMYTGGKYAEAAELFASLGNYSDSEQKHLKSCYALADEQLSLGRYEEALSGFAALGDYADSAERRSQTVYQMADSAFVSEDYSNAVSLYLSIEDYLDSRERAFESALALTGDRSAAQSMVDAKGLTPEELSRSIDVAERRALLGYACIDAGANHTVLLRTDGTVAACGDNTYGQCDVGSWKNIVQISAGANHTVGLRADGTVVAVGDNTYGQCSVDQLTGITKIAAGYTDTYALSDSGQITMCGSHQYDVITRLTGITDIYAGPYSAVAASGHAYVPSHPSCAVSNGSRVLSLAPGTGYLLTLELDGTLISSFDTGGNWKNIAFFDAGPCAVIATDTRGRVHSHFFRSTDSIDFSGVENAVLCAAGTSHYVFVLETGEIVAFGDNSFGQCDVEQLGSAI